MQVSRRHFLSTAAVAGAGAGLGNADRQCRHPFTQPASTCWNSAFRQTARTIRALHSSGRSSAAADGVGYLQVPPGTYRVSTLTIDRPVQIIGTPGRQCAALFRARVTLRRWPVQATSRSSVSHSTAFLKPLSDDSAKALITATDCQNLHIEQCRFLNSAATGIALTRCNRADHRLHDRRGGQGGGVLDRCNRA